jgi:hypothetical protein
LLPSLPSLASQDLEFFCFPGGTPGEGEVAMAYPAASGQINFFSLTILDQDLNLIDDIDDYFLHLQFIKIKKQSIEFLLTKLVEYVNNIFLMIGNYLYPSKINSFMEQQMYLYPDRMFSKYKNPN